jgi:hypothetical protein
MKPASTMVHGGRVTIHDETRRKLLKKAAYVAPLILSLQATSAVAKSGSEKEQRQKPKKLKVPKNQNGKKRA